MNLFLQKMIVFLSDIECILSPSLPQPRRWRLLRDYVRIRIKASLNRWMHFKREHFLSFKVAVPDYETFLAIFRQVFVRQAYYSRTKRENPIIIDCGGNMGMSVLYWKYIYPHARVTVFEPSREVIDALEHNVRENNLQDIALIQKAVSKENGSAVMYPRGAAACGNTLISSLAEEARPKDRAPEYVVETTRLSEYLPAAVDIIKFDIEGSEDVVLEELLRAHVLTRVREIVLEYHHDPEMGDKRLERILSICQEAQFDVQIFLEDLAFAPQRYIERHGVYALSMRMIQKDSAK